MRMLFQVLGLADEEPETIARKFNKSAYNQCNANNMTCILVRFHCDYAGEPQIEQQMPLEFHQGISAEPVKLVKFFILLRDIHKSIYFLDWKEQGSQLSLLAKDYTQPCSFR